MGTAKAVTTVFLPMSARKEAMFDVPIPAQWTSQPSHVSRTELQRCRKAAQLPHLSFDIDGDGVVSPEDFYASTKCAHAVRMRCYAHTLMDALLCQILQHSGDEMHTLLRNEIVGILMQYV